MKDYMKIIAFAGSVLITLAALSAFFNGRFWYNNGYVSNRDARLAGIEVEEPDQIDVLNVGSSLCDVSLTPLELYRDYGITSYNIGRDMQTRTETYYAILTALRSQKIKVLLWETDNLCKQKDIRKVDPENQYKPEQRDYMEPYRQELSEFCYYHFPILRYHYFWRNWANGIKHDEFYKGFRINKEIHINKKEYTRAEKLRAKIDLKHELTFQRDQMYAFKRIYNLCQANDIKLVLYSAPSMKYYQSRKRHDALTKLANQYGLDYIDGNFDEDIIGIDWDKDSFDGGAHLNLYGSRKMTKYLGEYLSKHCDLTDHREDPAYANWAEIDKYVKECGN